MKALALLFMVIAGIALILAAIMGVADKTFPIGNVPAEHLINFSQVCILFAIALSIYQRKT